MWPASTRNCPTVCVVVKVIHTMAFSERLWIKLYTSYSIRGCKVVCASRSIWALHSSDNGWLQCRAISVSIEPFRLRPFISSLACTTEMKLEVQKIHEEVENWIQRRSVTNTIHDIVPCAWAINEPHLPYKTGLDVMQSYPLRRTRFGQYQASSYM